MLFLYLPIIIVLGTAIFVGSVIYGNIPWIYAEAFFFVYAGLIIWWIEDKIEEKRLRDYAMAFQNFQEYQMRNPIVLEGKSETLTSNERAAVERYHERAAVERDNEPTVEPESLQRRRY